MSEVQPVNEHDYQQMSYADLHREYMLGLEKMRQLVAARQTEELPSLVRKVTLMFAEIEKRHKRIMAAFAQQN